MTPREQFEAIKQASALIFSVEKVRRAGDKYDERIARVCYAARVELAKVDSECLIELGIRERKSYNSICADRPASNSNATP